MSGSRRGGEGILGGTMGGTMGGSRARSARGSPGGMGGTFGTPKKGRPLSAPRMRNADSLFGGTGSPTDLAKARAEEVRQIREAGFLGREEYTPQELPAYWSVATYGEPFNDPRKAMGAVLQQQAGSGGSMGPAAQTALALRRSLMEGKRYFNRHDLSPIGEDALAEPLTEADRVMVLQRLLPYQRVHALRNMWDRDTKAKDFIPWTQLVWDKLDAVFWNRSKDLAIRMAVQKLENMMRRHLKYVSESRCTSARAPSSSAKEILREAFWKVDPQRTGMVSLAQFLQVWQNVLMLMQFEDVESRMVTGKTKMTLSPVSRFILDMNMCASIFVKFGFDKEGLMPYDVFSQALCAAPSRLLGEELVLDKKDSGKHGLSDDSDIFYVEGGAKIIYPKCEGGVFPPNGFDRRLAERSRFAPSAHMWLEHIYGYAGMDVNSTNIFYSHNTTKSVTEIVYYTGMVGVVLNKELWRARKPCQRFFFGHDNDIQCLAMHPGRRFVVTGQQKATGPDNVPFACVWDVDNCNEVQRLLHNRRERAVIAVCFSGNVNGPPDKKGGDVLVTVTADDKHTIHVWRWMHSDEKEMFMRAYNLPGWRLEPEKKLPVLKAAGTYYDNPDKFEGGLTLPGGMHHQVSLGQKGLPLKEWAKEPAPADVEQYKDMDHPLLNRARDTNIRLNPVWEEGFNVAGSQPPHGKDTYSILHEAPGCNGTPPMVYGIAWNPFRPQDGNRGSEFATYGVKHLKTWIVSGSSASRGSAPAGTWVGTSASFGNEHINNVLSCLYVQAMHYMAAPGDSCILTGFASGQIGLWIPPYPTQAGATYQLMRKIDAHDPGIKVRLNDGSQVYGGVRVLKLRAPKGEGANAERRVLSGGSDGVVQQWRLAAPSGKYKDGTPMRGVDLVALAGKDEKTGPNRFVIGEEPNNPPMIIGLDCIMTKQEEFVAGTHHCDIWEVDKDPEMLVEGQEEDIWEVALHSVKANIFATTCMSGSVRIVDTEQRKVMLKANVGFPITGVAFSNEEYGAAAYNNPEKRGFHLALGSKGLYTKGDWHKIAIVDAENLQPLKLLKEPTGQPGEIKFSPPGGPGILAAGSQDMRIYLYNAKRDYQYIGRCCGHSSTVESLDWLLPVSLPGTKLHGEFLLMASDASGNIMYWHPKTVRPVTHNQRDTAMYTNTCKLGFNVMGIWPDNSGAGDINAVCRSWRGAPKYDPKLLGEGATGSDRASNVEFALEEESADGIPGAGYLAVADDFSTVRLLNYPVVWDDSPSKAYAGHASHVMCVRFSCDDRLVISAGGFDRGMYQWRTIGINQEDTYKDKCLMAARKLLLKERTAGDPIFDLEATDWVPQGPDGKTMGPVKVRDSRAFSQSPRANPSAPTQPLAGAGGGGNSGYSSFAADAGGAKEGGDSGYSSFAADAGGAKGGGLGRLGGSRPTTPQAVAATPPSGNSRPTTPASAATAPPSASPNASSRPGTATGSIGGASRPGTPGTTPAPATPSSRPGSAMATTPAASRPGTSGAGAATAPAPGSPRAPASARSPTSASPRPVTPSVASPAPQASRPATPGEAAAAAAAAAAASGGSSLFNSNVSGGGDSGGVSGTVPTGGGGPATAATSSRPSSALPRSSAVDGGSLSMSGNISMSGDLDAKGGVVAAAGGRPSIRPGTAGAKPTPASKPNDPSGGDSLFSSKGDGDLF